MSNDTNPNDDFIKDLQDAIDKPLPEPTPELVPEPPSNWVAPVLPSNWGSHLLTWKERQKLGRNSTRFARRMPDALGVTFQDQQGKGYVRCADGSVRRTKD